MILLAELRSSGFLVPEIPLCCGGIDICHILHDHPECCLKISSFRVLLCGHLSIFISFDALIVGLR
jgi:hypothetical protein